MRQRSCRQQLMKSLFSSHTLSLDWQWVTLVCFVGDIMSVHCDGMLWGQDWAGNSGLSQLFFCMQSRLLYLVELQEGTEDQPWESVCPAGLDVPIRPPSFCAPTVTGLNPSMFAQVTIANLVIITLPLWLKWMKWCQVIKTAVMRRLYHLAVFQWHIFPWGPLGFVVLS